ncbi:MAG: hypothetical protein Q8910_00620 [Bacteroidota bacterium]|nr:hypothetical protein [Bacteroidota bacterium]
MKNKPIENPRFIGCLNCSPTQTVIISKDRYCDVGFGGASLDIDDESIDLNERGLTLGEIENLYADKLASCDVAEIVLFGPMHGETFELNKEDGNWYLTEQNEGFA